MKHVYKAIILVFVFGIAIFCLKGQIKEITVDYDTTVSMGEPSFPLLYVKTDDYTVNEMHGYSSRLDGDEVRESMTLLDSGKTLKVLIDDSENEIKKIGYEITLVSSGESVEEGSISAIEKEDDQNYVKIKVKADLEQGKEYAVVFTTVTASGKKIYYYTRLKYYGDDSYFTDKMDFAMNFHDSTFDDNKLQELSSYLESGTSDDTSLAKVTISSSLSNIGWGDLEPEIVSEVVPVITEYALETASITLTYYVTADTGGSVNDLYKIKECIRVRYANSRMYLLDYQRTMDEVFNVSLSSTETNQFKVGITNNTNMKLYSSAEEQKLCFVQEGALWYIDTIESKAVRVFSFLEDSDQDYARSGYDQHDIQILDMDDEGNIDFMLYGYFNRGDYEGRVGIILYKYYAAEDRIQELVYIPMNTTYQVLKEDLNDLGYLSSSGIYYFTIENNIYSYDIASKKLTTIAENINEDNVIVLKDSHYMVWQSENNAAESTELDILDLETGKTNIIEASDKENIVLLGSSANNIIYGFVKTSDIVTSKQGSQTVPMYEIIIANGTGDVLKTYKKKNIYITECNVKDNVIQLKRVKKSSDGFTSLKSDSIINNQYSVQDTFELVSAQSETALNEYYIDLPSDVTLKKVPTAKDTVNTVINESTTLQLEEKLTFSTKYYVYGYGEITGAYSSISSAVSAANEVMGVVVSNDYKVVWERGGKYLRNTISNYSKVTTSYSVDSIGASIMMALENAGVSVDDTTAQEITASDSSIYQILKKYNSDGTTYNLTGCTLDEVLYYVSSGELVIAMKSQSQAVVLVGYDEYYVYYYDPSSGSVKTALLANGESMFEESGYVFYVTY